MALPVKIDPSVPAPTEDIQLGDDHIKNIKSFLVDVLGAPSGQNVTAAALKIETNGEVSQINMPGDNKGQAFMYDGDLVVVDSQVCVESYGASPSKTAAQNTTAFTDAINDATHKVIIPQGLYDLNSVVANRAGKAGLQLLGCGPKTILRFDTTGIGLLVKGAAIQTHAWGQDHLYHIGRFNLQTINNRPTSIITIGEENLGDVSDLPMNMLVEKINVIGGPFITAPATAPGEEYVKADYCLDILGGYGCTLQNCVFCGVDGTMIRFRQNASNNDKYTILAKVLNCDFTCGINPGVGIEIEGGELIVVSDTVLQILRKAVITAGVTAVRNLRFDNCWFELNLDYDLQTQGDTLAKRTRASFSNCSFVAGTWYTETGTPKISFGAHDWLNFTDTQGPSDVAVTCRSVVGGGLSKVWRHNSPTVKVAATYPDQYMDLDSLWRQRGFAAPGLYGTGNSIGNGTLAGHWTRVPGGFCRLQVQLIIGSTTTIVSPILLGETVFFDSYPAEDALLLSYVPEMGQALYFRASTSELRSGICQISPGTNNRIEMYSHGTLGAIAGTPPWGGSWAPGDNIRIDLHYQCKPETA
jgi:hypothetical protein